MPRIKSHLALIPLLLLSQIEPAALGFDLALSRGIYSVGIIQKNGTD